MRQIEIRRHTMRVKPGQHLSQAGVDLARRVGGEIGPFARIVTSTIPRAFETAIAMGFAVDEQYDGLNILPHGVEDEVAWNAGFTAFARAVQRGGIAAAFSKILAAYWQSVAENLSTGQSALLITHGGLIEAGAVSCLPAADHAEWGAFCDYCEGIRLTYEDGQFTGVEILRVERE